MQETLGYSSDEAERGYNNPSAKAVGGAFSSLGAASRSMLDSLGV